MCVTDRHDMTSDVKGTLNRNTIHQPTEFFWNNGMYFSK